MKVNLRHPLHLALPGPRLRQYVRRDRLAFNGREDELGLAEAKQHPLLKLPDAMGPESLYGRRWQRDRPHAVGRLRSLKPQPAASGVLQGTLYTHGALVEVEIAPAEGEKLATTSAAKKG